MFSSFLKFLSNTCMKLSHLSLFFSFLEEDPLYIAYADMMAKVTLSPPRFDRLLTKLCRSPSSVSELC